MSKSLARAFVAGAAGLALTVWIALMASSLASRTVKALPIYAQRTGFACGQCHVNPSGGGPRTAFGRAFAANGHRLPGRSRRRDRSESREDYGPGYGYGPGMTGHYGPGMYGPGMMGGHGGMMGGYHRW
jgi:hypothetical protein